MSIDFSRHEEFKDEISMDMYNSLKRLSEICNGQPITEDDVNLKNIIKDIQICKDEPSVNKMKLSIHYIRLCSIIVSLIKEYEDYGDEFKKKLIDYYIQSNSMKEMNNVGLGWYYDMKYKKDRTTLYSVGYGKPSNWHEWIKNCHNECNQIKENGVQLIFRACMEHINRGGAIRLKSLSKCLGVDLFKYMHLDKNNFANLYIIKDVTINFIEYEGSRISLQEYLSSDTYSSFDSNKNPNFCLDFSHPRKDKAKNYNNWSKNFLTDGFISQAEFEERKKAFGIEEDKYDYFILTCLNAEHTKGGDRAVSSRISPIADKEVVTSDTLWKIEEYTGEVSIRGLSEKCYHITFDESEYYHLIFSYFKAYYEKKYNGQKSFDKSYDSQLAREKEEIKRNITKLEKENKQLLNQDDANLQNEDIKSRKKKIDENSLLISFYDSYKESLKAAIINDTNAKVQFALSFVDWSIDKIPENWSLNNTYTVNENTEKNLKLNLYKCLCKRAALV